jgi:hypothetical protein
MFPGWVSEIPFALKGLCHATQPHRLLLTTMLLWRMQILPVDMHMLILKANPHKLAQEVTLPQSDPLRSLLRLSV